MSKLLLIEEKLSFSLWTFYESDHLEPIMYLSFYIMIFNCYKVGGHAFFSSLRHWEFETEWAQAPSIWGRTFSFCLSLTASFRPRSRLGVQAEPIGLNNANSNIWNFYLTVLMEFKFKVRTFSADNGLC